MLFNSYEFISVFLLGNRGNVVSDFSRTNGDAHSRCSLRRNARLAKFNATCASHVSPTKVADYIRKSRGIHSPLSSIR